LDDALIILSLLADGALCASTARPRGGLSRC
jgi:hypothetical protein